MKLVVNRDLLTRALGHVQGVVNRKATMPALSNVLLEAFPDGRLRVAATDLDVTFDGHVNARVSEPGRTTVDGKRIFEVVRSLAGEEVELAVGDEERITLHCKNADFTLHGASPDAYPQLPSIGGADLFPVDGEALRELLDRTLFSVSTDESRPNLNGVYFRCVAGNRIRMVSTDGHRLSQGERLAERGADIPERDGVIIPRKGCTELKRLLDEAGRDVSFGFLENNLVVTGDNLSLFVRLIDAAFPDYNQVVPKSCERHVVADRVAYLEALKRTALLASERTHGVRVDLTSGRMVLHSENPDLGKAREEVDVDYDAGDLSIAFNARYVRDILSILGAEKVKMSLNEALSPGLFREDGSEDYMFVVMPMRL